VEQVVNPELRVEAPESLASTAERIRRLDPAAVARIMRLVGITDAGAPITLVLATEDMEIARRTPRWVAGFARSAGGLIVIFPARSLSYPYDSLDDVVRHEIAHVLIARAAGNQAVPRWFHEGVALSAERSWGFEDRTRVAFALTGQRWSARELDAAFDAGGRRTGAAYALSGALVRDVIERHGADAPARILSRMAAGDRFDAAFASVTGATVRTFADGFWRASWWSEVVPFVTSSVMLWFAVTILGLYAFRTRRARRMARRKAWEEEERLQKEQCEPRLDRRDESRDEM
jgi:hypothetical protein